MRRKSHVTKTALKRSHSQHAEDDEASAAPTQVFEERLWVYESRTRDGWPSCPEREMPADVKMGFGAEYPTYC